MKYIKSMFVFAQQVLAYEKKEVPPETAPILDGEENKMESMTMPDQNMELREILTRHANGLPLGAQRVPFYDYDNPDHEDLETAVELENYKRMDLADQEAFRARHELKLRHLQVALNQKQADKTAYEARVAQMLRDHEESKKKPQKTETDEK